MTKYPADFTKCPNCESESRLAGDVIKKEIENGRSGPTAQAFTSLTKGLIHDPSKPFLSAPLLTCYYDVCGECGTVYCIHAELGKAMADGKQIMTNQN